MVDGRPFKKKCFIRFLSRAGKWGLCTLVLTALLACSHRALRLSLPESPLPYDQAWKSAIDASLVDYKRIAIEDKQAGYFQTTWNIHKVGLIIGHPVKRSRLIGRVTNRVPFRLDIDMEQEAFSMELGRWVSDPPDRKRLADILERMRARLLF
ncbi:MAG: hypothetical protein ACE5GK_05355 [Nitrospiria bacterium]